jgi:hypothetical protein
MYLAGQISVKMFRGKMKILGFYLFRAAQHFTEAYRLRSRLPFSNGNGFVSLTALTASLQS